MSYPLSTAEAVLRRVIAKSEDVLESTFLLSTAEAVLRHSMPKCDNSVIVKFLLSTAEAVLRPPTGSVCRLEDCNFYCLPLRRY